MTEAQLFTVRVWRQQAQFRAALRAVGEERAELFTEPAAVAAYLQQASGAARSANEVPAGEAEPSSTGHIGLTLAATGPAATKTARGERT